MRIRKALVGTALSLSLWASPAFGQPFDGPHAGAQAGPERTEVRLAEADPASATPDDPSVRQEAEGTCCNGMGGPIEEEPVVVVGHLADPAGERRRLVPIDADLERRYAPGPTPGLNPITLRF